MRMSTEKEIKIETSIGYLIKQGQLLEIRPFRDRIVDFDIDAAHQLIADSVKITDLQPHLVLWDASDSELIVHPEVRETFSKSEEASQYRKALAFVVNSLPNRIVANFFVNVNKPPAPAAVFENREEALVFLEKYRD